MPAFSVFPNQSIRSIVERLPLDLAHLAGCASLGQKRCDDYGATLLDMVAHHVVKHGRTGNVTPAAGIISFFACFFLKQVYRYK